MFHAIGMPHQMHLKRLSHVWAKHPAYFITTCVADRRHLLANPLAYQILTSEWNGMFDRYGWAVGRHVVMPDHVHFFIAPAPESPHSLSLVVGKWKEWTAKLIMKASHMKAPFWESEFFDHLIRSHESRTEKWNYVRDNPVRAGLVRRAEDWPYAGAIHFE